MKLRFLATPSAKVPERHQDGSAMARPNDGGSFRYVGWTFDPKADGHAVVSKDPYECDTDAAPSECAYLAKCCREGDLVPADKSTADFCGVQIKAAKAAKGDS